MPLYFDENFVNIFKNIYLKFSWLSNCLNQEVLFKQVCRHYLTVTLAVLKPGSSYLKQQFFNFFNKLTFGNRYAHYFIVPLCIYKIYIPDNSY